MRRNTFDLKLTANIRPIHVLMSVSRNDRRYSPEISPRLSTDPTHYVRVREVREGVTEAPQREASASLKSASWPVNLLCCAALGWTDIPSFSDYWPLFTVDSSLHWRMLRLPLTKT